MLHLPSSYVKYFHILLVANEYLKGCKYEGGRSLSAVALELGFVVSTANPSVEDAAHIKEHVKGMAVMKLMIIRKK
jgi:hypothetical protein